MPVWGSFTGGGFSKRQPLDIIRSNLVLNLDANQRSSYPGTGTTWFDVSGNGNNATSTGNPAFTSGNQSYFSFSGTQYFSCSSSSSFAFGTGDFAIECWYYPTSFSSYHHMIALPDQNTFGLKSNISNGEIYFYSTAFTTYPTTNWVLTLNSWNHVVFVRASSIAYPYLNGVPYSSKSGFTNNFSAQVCNIHYGWSNEFADARISVVRIYNNSLSSTQVLRNFNALRGRFGI